MGSCENMRGRWRRGSSGSLMSGIGLLLFSLAQSTSAQAHCPIGGGPRDLTQPKYQGDMAEDTGVGFMSAIVQSFLSTVQPNHFPEDLILKLVRDLDQVQSDPDTIKAVLHYEIGFLVCLAIGILYIVLMPLVGFFLACCRCCGNCGGEMYQKQTSGVHCHRRALYWSAFITTLIILAGNICMFRSNEDFRVNVNQSVMELSNTLDNLQTYLTSVPQQIDLVVNESCRTVNEVAGNLNAIGPQLGKEIQVGFQGPLDPALDSVRNVDQEVNDTSDRLGELTSSLARLQSSADLLQANLSTVRNNINQTLSNRSCVGCSSLKAELGELTVDVSVAIPGLSSFQSAVEDIIEADLKSKIEAGEDYYNTIPQRVTNDTKDVVQRTKVQLEDIKRQMSQVSSDLPLAALTNVSDSLVQLERDISTHVPEVKRAEYIRWAVCVVLCCIVLVVVVCNILGLLLGPLGLKPKADPTERSSTANCGGTFLMMSAGFSFLFSWLFMVAVVLLFLLGGNVYMLVCQPWHSGALLKFIDTPGLIPEFELGPMLGLKTNLTFTDIYSDCEQNRPLWSTLHLHELVNLEELLNVSKYTEEMKQHFESTDIVLSSITLLSPEVQNRLSSLSSVSRHVDFNTVTQQINNISSINFNATARRLDQLADVQPDREIQAELRAEAADLRRIQANMDTSIVPQVQKLNSTIQRLRAVAEKINGTVGEVLSKVGAAQDFLDTNATQIVKTESRQFLDCQLGYFTAYADWANMTITRQVGRCGPVARAVKSAEVVICSYMVESLNAFWFSLGWCVMFFIPSIILTIKLAKYYRRMDSSDVYSNHIAMNHIPRAHIRPY
ncbi:prominin-2 [Lampris incognitus]|uniref:prominin-2 n=1 Tax=Lampris incognitus TaxID=2546036 RepID=UPI0024B50F75|nr:prominin-2 [Lampris incognitus]